MRNFLLLLLLTNSFTLKAQSTNTTTEYSAEFRAYIQANSNDPAVQAFLGKLNTSEKKQAGQRSTSSAPDITHNYRWNIADWIFLNRSTVTARDNNNNVTTELLEDVIGGNDFQKRYQTETTYHNADVAATITTVQWNTETNAWTAPTSLLEFRPSGHLEYLEFATYDFFLNEQSFGMKEEYNYDSNDFYEGSTRYRWDVPTTTWVPDYNIVREANADGYAKYSVSREWEEATPGYYVAVDSTIFSYTSEGLLSESIVYQWDVFSDTWKIKYKNTFDYNGNDLLEMKTTETWDISTNDWRNDQEMEYAYNSNDQPTTTFQKTWDDFDNVWVDDFSYVNTYDANSNLLTAIGLQWDYWQDDWYGWQNISNAYENSNKTESVSKGWSYTNWDWENRDSSVYFYGVGVTSNNTLPDFKELSISPNPSNGLFTIDYDLNGIETTYNIVNAQGETLLQRKLTEKTQSIDLTVYPKGLYFLVLPNGETAKLIRQ